MIITNAVMLAFFMIQVPVPQKAPSEFSAVIILDPGHGGRDLGGYAGKGFFLNGQVVSENSYAYDIAKRIERLAVGKNWVIVFTTLSQAEISISANNEDVIIPPMANLRYNLPGKPKTPFKNKIGLILRAQIAEQALKKYPRSPKIFISLHFDYTGASGNGIRIFTAENMVRDPFILALNDQIKKAGLEYRIINRIFYSISPSRYVVIKEGVVNPRILVELGNFNNPRDRKLMLSADGREKYANIITAAVESYLAKKKSKNPVKSSKINS